MNIEDFLPEIKKKILLKNYTSFKIGGRAKYFFEAKTKEDIIKSVKAAKKTKLPFFVFGGGSNLLISDTGFKGLIIKILNTKYKIKNTKIYAEAGVPLSLLPGESIKNNLAGLEWAAGIPGTLGGAVFGNAGAFGKSMKDVVEKVEALDVKDLKLKIYDSKKCKFGYRESVFKKKNNLIIVSVVIKLKNGKGPEIKKTTEEHIDYKKKTQPLNYPSVGSVFKNPEKTFAAKLIDDCGLRGRKIGMAQISEKHANFIVNLGNAKAKEVEKLIKLAKKEVKNRFNVVLKEEIRYLGF